METLSRKVKLFIQIPCLNEEKTLPLVIADLPRKIEGISEIYTLVIDDGSTDDTVNTARRLGVDYIIKNRRTLGLATAYSRGLEACLFLGADIIVNIDGDNQHKGANIGRLVEPILLGHSDMVVGCRGADKYREFSWSKKILQKIGNHVVKNISGTKIPDVTSGFRAINRFTALQFSVMSYFSYTLETLIQAGRSGLEVGWVPTEANPKTRSSRLFKSNLHFIYHQVKTILMVYIFYRPMSFFNYLGAVFACISFAMSLRVMYFLLWVGVEHIRFKIGSAILLLLCAIITVLLFVTGFIGSVLSGLRFLIIDLRRRVRNIEFKQGATTLNFDIITSDELFKWAKEDNKVK